MTNQTLLDMFNKSMEREHKTVTVLYTREVFDCFFRKSNDNTNEKDTMAMYYYANAPVKVGTLLSFRGKTFLVLNKETTENDVYCKSAIIRTTGKISTHSLSVLDLPIYSESINNANVTVTSNLTVIDGNIDLLTEDNEISRQLRVNDLFNEFGRTWKISNLFYVDGICQIVCEVNEDISPIFNYRLEITSLAAINVSSNDTDSISATAYINDNEIRNATITYSSSDSNVASIDSEGNIAYLAEGEVYFTAYWHEQDITEQTSTVTVLSTPTDDSVNIYVEPLDEICYDFPETLNFYAMRGGVRDDSIPVSFKIENLSVTNNLNTYLKKIVITDNGDYTIELAVNGSVMLGKTFDLVAYNDECKAESRQNIKVVSLF